MRFNTLRNTEILKLSLKRPWDIKPSRLIRSPLTGHTPIGHLLTRSLVRRPHIACILMISFQLMLLGGCASVTIHPTASVPKHRPPDFEQSVPFSWFGIAGTHHFDVQALCGGRAALKIRTLHTFKDLMVGLTTGFFRLPKTAQIWCQPEHPDNGLSTSDQLERRSLMSGTSPL